MKTKPEEQILVIHHRINALLGKLTSIDWTDCPDSVYTDSAVGEHYVALFLHLDSSLGRSSALLDSTRRAQRAALTPA